MIDQAWNCAIDSVFRRHLLRHLAFYSYVPSTIEPLRFALN